MIELTEDRAESLSEHIEQGLRHIGKAMQCLDEWMKGGYSERGRSYPRGYGERYGERYEGRDDRDDYGERGRRDSRGRYN